jgi:hypothetical protein
VLPLIALGRDAAQARLGRDAAQAPLGRDAAQARLGRDAAQARPDRDAALGREASSLPAVLSSQSEAEDDALATGRDVLAVHRRVEAAADPNRYGSFAELMAARRMKSRR